MSNLQLYIDKGNENTWQIESMVLESGTTPSRCVVVCPMESGESRPVPSETLEVLTGVQRVFLGKLRETIISYDPSGPAIVATYADFFYDLAMLGNAASFVNVAGDVRELKGAKLIFNEHAEANKCRDFENAFLMDRFEGELWNALDIIKYIRDRVLKEAIEENIVDVNISDLPQSVSKRMTAITPFNFRLKDKDVIGGWLRLCKMCGVEIVRDYDTTPPTITFVNEVDRDATGIVLDAGSPGSVLNADNVPDICSFQCKLSRQSVPEKVTIHGLRRELEVTLQTGKRFNSNGVLEDASWRESDIIPDWTQLEHMNYEFVCTNDPYGRDPLFDPLRKELTHVYRRYRVNPNFLLRGFFGAIGSPCNLEAIESFAGGMSGLAVPPEVLFRIKDRGWRIPEARFGGILGVITVDGGLAFELADRVWIAESTDPQAMQVEAIGFSLCLTEKETDSVTVNTADYFPELFIREGEEERVIPGLVKRIYAPGIQRIFRRIETAPERDDNDFAQIVGLVELERFCSQEEGKAVLPGIRTDVTPSTLLEKISFDRGIGGVSAQEIPVLSRVSRVTVEPSKLQTRIEW